MEEQFSLEKLVENVKGKKVIDRRLFITLEKVVLESAGYDAYTDARNYCNLDDFEREKRIVLRILEDNGYETYELRKKLNEISSELSCRFISYNKKTCKERCECYNCCKEICDLQEH